MAEKIENKCSLKLDNLVFDKINFNRQGKKNSNVLEFSFTSSIAKAENEQRYKINLSMQGTKKDEYTIEISILGYFTICMDENLSQDIKQHLIQKNTIAILMPYIRSEISLLTAQPGMDCVVLPPFNINGLFPDDNNLKF